MFRSMFLTPLVLLVAVVLPSGSLVAQAPASVVNQTFPWRNIGPAAMMGRISAIDALDNDYRTVLIGSAQGIHIPEIRFNRYPRILIQD